MPRTHRRVRSAAEFQLWPRAIRPPDIADSSVPPATILLSLDSQIEPATIDRRIAQFTVAHPFCLISTASRSMRCPNWLISGLRPKQKGAAGAGRSRMQPAIVIDPKYNSAPDRRRGNLQRPILLHLRPPTRESYLVPDEIIRHRYRARIELCDGAKLGSSATGTDSHKSRPSSRPPDRHSDEHGLRAIGGAHGLPVGLAAGQ
jgi:hypothetical protein